MRRNPNAVVSITLALAASLGAGCRDAKERAPEPIPECAEGYMNAYRACLSRVGPGAEGAMKETLAAVRTSIDVAPADEAERTAARERCIAGTRALTAACH